jgi:Uncharacterized protein conserved in bacteria (DUF2252)
VAATADIGLAEQAYEDWLDEQLGGDLKRDDLREKWEKMASEPFVFLRATYWRWAETILDTCPHLANAPATLAIGDTHLENFGVWRDEDGRLVWGVNDFDEAAEMPYVLDLVRLATSALLARSMGGSKFARVCSSILEGYERGLEKPRPYVLDKKHAWLRTLLVVSDQERAEFWKKMEKLKAKSVPAAYRKAIEAAMPDPTARIERYAPRAAGTGSLGRPRWVGIARWRGGLLVREAKALAPSGWTRIEGRGTQELHGQELALGRYRAPDPWYAMSGGILVRRLSPNARKIEVDEHAGDLLRPRMLRAMGRELASVHLGTGDGARAIKRDFSRRPRQWLQQAAEAAAMFVTAEFRDWEVP